MTRYFRSTDEVLSLVNAQLDAAYGYPNEATRTSNALPPAAECPHDAEGRVYLAVDGAYCDFILPSEMLPQLIDSGMTEEIDEATYGSILPPA
jgi:hypothetical protein